MRRKVAIGLLGLGLVSCPGERSVAPPEAAPVAAGGTTVKRATPAGEAAEKPDLHDQSFAESAQNRDPFRSYLEDVARPTGQIETDVNVLMQEYSLDEIKLIGTVAGGAAPRAMFQDPHGLGVIVQRGDHISSAAARVTRILPGKVFIEVKQGRGSKSDIGVRELELNPEAAVQ